MQAVKRSGRAGTSLVRRPSRLGRLHPTSSVPGAQCSPQKGPSSEPQVTARGRRTAPGVRSKAVPYSPEDGWIDGMDVRLPGMPRWQILHETMHMSTTPESLRTLRVADCLISRDEAKHRRPLSAREPVAWLISRMALIRTHQPIRSRDHQLTFPMGRNPQQHSGDLPLP